MTEEQRRRGPAATQVEATGQHVQANVARLRKARGWTTYTLAQKMADAGRPIPQSGISRIESGGRRVDVDDLTALAVVLGVSPAALLLPLKDSPAETVPVTGAGDVSADTAWAWASNEGPLRIPEGADVRTVALEYQLYSLPPGRATKAIKIGGQWFARLGVASDEGGGDDG
jgi:transcriptional regulator with XRE-family HTH domain